MSYHWNSIRYIDGTLLVPPFLQARRFPLHLTLIPSLVFTNAGILQASVHNWNSILSSQQRPWAPSLIQCRMTHCMLTFHPLTLGVWKTKLTTFSSNSQPLAPSLSHVFPLVKQVLAHVYEFSGVLPVCVLCMHTICVPKEARKGHRVTWNWSYRCSWAAMWVLKVNLGFFQG